MKFTPVEGNRFTKERLLNTLFILGVLSLPLIIIAVIFNWQNFITAWWICLFISAITTLIFKSINFFRRGAKNLN
ncbi:MAG: hypothetical protein JWR54_1078 [Mucilaginibacter sp.]|jgi:uncharacterized membrane protein (DUF4010 family)|nr:hypothetical protein [Mucilaginibacter sp.]